jgi:peptide/nickel transport system substrate-binding protein
MKRTFAVGTALIAVAGLAACTSGNSAGGSRNGTGLYPASKLITTTPAATKPVAKVTWGLVTGEPTTLNPVQAGTDSAYVVNANLCENLLTLTPKFGVAPGLATSAKWTDRTTFTITVRHGVKFWDGTPMTAADVAYSLQQNANPKSGSVSVGLFEGVTSIAATGSDTVVVKFKTPNSQFRTAMATSAGVVFEKAYAEKAGKSLGAPGGGLMCTGPFELKSWTAGKNIVTTANPDYWNGKPLVKELDYEFIPDNATLTASLRSGEVDGAYDLPTSSARALAKGTNGAVHFGPSTGTLSFGPVASTGPAADPRVRQALNLAIDKQAYVRTVLGGYGYVAKTFSVPATFTGLPDAAIYQKGYDALPAAKTDLAAAKKLVAQANPGKKPLVLAIPAGNQELLQSATIIQAAGKQLGLTITIKQLQATDFAGLFYSASARKGIDFLATMGYLNAPGPIANATFFTMPPPMGLYNWSQYSNPTVTKYLTAANTTTSDTAAAQDFAKAQRVFNPAQVQVTLGGKYSSVFLSNKLTGATVSFAYVGLPWALHLGAK